MLHKIFLSGSSFFVFHQRYRPKGMAVSVLARVGLRLAAKPLYKSCLPIAATPGSLAANMSANKSRVPLISNRLGIPQHKQSLLLPLAQRFRFQSTLAAPAALKIDPYRSEAAAASIASHASAQYTPVVSRPIVALHLYALAFLVYAIVVVGGLTRLTESGLSITEWNPGFKGMRLPSTTQEWEAEWDKYKQTPEFHLLNSKMSLEDFKSIYMWEWAHRVLGRVIGLTFVFPAAYFVSRRWVAPGTRWKLGAIALGIGFQGFLGWFMVKSGLTVPGSKTGKAKTAPVVSAATAGGRSEMPTSSATTSSAFDGDWTPRVSHFRLAAHMGTAFLVYLAMLHTGLAVQRDWNVVRQRGKVSGLSTSSSKAMEKLANTLNHPSVRGHARLTAMVAALVFTTAMSGALVAGLDAGLVYNEFPTMGDGRVAPPLDELMDDKYAQQTDKSDKVWRNLTQNPVTVQLIHRTLAITTAFTVLGLAWRTRRLALSHTLRAQSSSSAHMLPALPSRIVRLGYASAAVVGMQVTLGITTLIYMVPIPLASAHQAGSLALLSVLVALLSSMRPIPTSLLKHIRSLQPRKLTPLQRVLKS